MLHVTRFTILTICHKSFIKETHRAVDTPFLTRKSCDLHQLEMISTKSEIMQKKNC